MLIIFDGIYVLSLTKSKGVGKRMASCFYREVDVLCNGLKLF